ncbi:helix-turn-helix domain-containing protein [Lysobacter gummosus]|uniref:helix-turn-helix domain-containing protein n=1 Tax=Lysobacter gummosus TaxID=262324 RepID=UPI003641734C
MSTFSWAVQSQSGAARKLGWPQQRLSAVEAGARRLDIMEFFQLATVLGLSPERAAKLVLQTIGLK